ncbi:amidase family protein [Oxalobacter aliiformigenes]|uniref:amidase family protein n=1 Tax=Oxalobacter aliiformigenes TaxID=2946593 RepID=UPI0022B0284B|nr:amidase family protein [Oxalobacter aliiformigenes]MCZ4063957.1 amidase family protein [Oxalobacter aliiformigenes]WAV98577.1 amidase family protein [Oxalobacter aliiformigenes]
MAEKLQAEYRPFEKTTPELQEAMRKGQLTSRELVSYYLKRIKVYDGVLNSMITVNPKAMETAENLDKLRSAGKVLGPLHGIPVVLKDNYDTDDMVTTSGSRALATLLPRKDAFTVDRLRKAGAVIIGKTNMTEFARHGMTISSLGGQTLNPYDLTRTPGGSSGGTGAAVAANFAVMGTGSDTMNSIRSPSSANSLVGIRPTRGLVSRSGIAPCSFWQDMGGPIARSVADAAIMLNVMAGYDPSDSSTVVVKDRKIPDYTQALDKDGLKRRKIALLTTNLGNDPEVRRIVDIAVKDIEKQGATVVMMDVPELYIPRLSKENDVQQWEQKIDLDKYLKAQGDASPVKNINELVATGQLTPSIAAEMASIAAGKDPENDPEYHARLARNAELRDKVVKLMEEQKIDAFLYPLQSILVVRTNDARGQAARNGQMASLTGLPAITLPGGFSKPSDTAPLGVPVGIELMGKPFSEETLIGMGFAYEQATRHRLPPRSVPDLDFSSVK